MEDFTIDLAPLPSGVAGEYRNKNEDGQSYRRDLLDRGSVLTVAASLPLLYHGTLSPGGDEASLLVFDFRFNSAKSARRFTNAAITIIFRDSEGEARMDPVVRSIAPEDVSSVDASTDYWQVSRRFEIGTNVGIDMAGANANFAGEKSGQMPVTHAVTLVGNRKLLGKDRGGKNAVVWSMEEDKEETAGIPSFLRAALVLQRKPDRSFTFDIEVRESVDWVSEVGARIKHFFGKEHSVEVDDVSINPGKHILKAWDSELVAFTEKTDWTNLGGLNLQDELVKVTMRKSASGRGE